MTFATHDAPPDTSPPRLVALIGIDGSGKSTQASLLVDWLRDLGHDAYLHPNESLRPVKRMLAEVAERRGFTDAASMLGRETHHLLLATIKWNTLNKVFPRLGGARGFVVMDRYSYCQTAAARCLDMPNAWLFDEMFAHFPRPDLTLLLDVAPEVAIRRLERRDGEGVDTPAAFLRLHAHAYRELPSAGEFVLVDGEGSVADVQRACRTRLAARFPVLRACHESHPCM